MASIINIKYKNVNNIKEDPLPEDKLFLNFDNSLILDRVKTQLTVKCKCGHSVIIPVYEDKNYVIIVINGYITIRQCVLNTILES